MKSSTTTIASRLSLRWPGVVAGALCVVGAVACANVVPQTVSRDTGDKDAASDSEVDAAAATPMALDASSGADSAWTPPQQTVDASVADSAVNSASVIYVVSDASELLTFDPASLTLTSRGTIRCPGEPTASDPFSPARGSVNSMAIDRDGYAWVNYNDGRLFEVDTRDLDCQPTSFVAGQAGFTWQLGMAFVSDGPGSTKETLYVSDNGGPGGQGNWGKGLARIDLTTMKLIPIGGYTWPNAGFNAELTGTGDGYLYGFFTTTPAGVAEIDTWTGATQGTTTLADVNNVNGGYAMAFWGGDLWFFTAYPTAQDPGATTTITRYDRLADQTIVVMKNVGRTIVGAGVSTAAPTSYPH